MVLILFRDLATHKSELRSKTSIDKVNSIINT